MCFLFVLSLLTASSLAQAATDYRSQLSLDEAHRITRGSPGVVIATLNTGVNYDLPEFRGRIPRNSDGTYGYDAVKEGTDAMDWNDFGLGTKVASLIAGSETGMAPESTLLPIRTFDENGSSSDAIILRAMLVAVRSGAKIIEFGGGPLANMSKPLCEAFQQVDERGQLLILPGGNDAKEVKEHPLGCPIRNLIVATASDAEGNLAKFANYGFSAIHVAAPGVKVPALGRDGVVSSDNTGASFSAAITAGIAALVWSAHPEYTPAQVRAAIIRGAKPSEGLRGKVRANGVINALGAVQADTTRAE